MPSKIQESCYKLFLMKKTNFQLTLSLALFCLSSSLLHAQNSPDHSGLCGTETYQQFLSRHPKQRLIQQNNLREKSKLGPQDAPGILLCNPSGVLPEIPVVVHVMHLGEAVGTGSNISVAQINDALRGLNERWSKAIGDGVAVPVRFALAKRAPDGSPTTGIVRVNTTSLPRYASEGIQSVNNGPGVDDRDLKDLSIWPIDQYYNVWVVHDIQGSVLGFAHYPNFNEAPYPYDGTVIERNAMIYNSITLTHEMGHAFNLAHTFEGDDGSTCPPNVDCSVDGDGVCDTPPHREDDCGPTNPCSTTGIWDNSRLNYMSYCGSAVSTRFTTGQSERVLYALQHSVRNTLPISLGNSPTGNAVEFGIAAFLLQDFLLCDSSFSPQIRLVNYGTQPINTLTYSLTLDNVNLGTFTLSPNLAAGASAAISLRQLSGLSVGSHELSIVISDVNGAGDGAYDYDNSICVQFEHRSAIADFCADFENSSDLPAGFSTKATGQIKPKALSVTCDAQGTYALEVNGVGQPDTSYTAIIGPIDFSKNAAPQLFFDLARQAGFYCNTFAGMRISASGDCGNTYELVYHKNDAPGFTCGGKNYLPTTLSLATTTRQSDPSVVFSPSNCQQWRKEMVDLAAFAGQKVFLKFEFYFNFTGDEANTIFLDNLCINNCTQGVTANISKDPAERTTLCRTGTLKLGAQANNAKGSHLLWEAASSADGVYNSIGARSDTSFSATMNTIGNYYFRLVSIKGGCADTSKVAEVIVNGALRFEKHPLSVSFCNNEPLALAAEISSNYSQLSYQWQRSNTLSGFYSDIPNATQSTYAPTTPGVSYYRVRARSADSGCTEVFSFEASATVDDSVDIQQDPEGFAACIGGKDTLTVRAAGSRQKYSWQEASSATGNFQQVGTQTTYVPNLSTLGSRYFRVLIESERGFCKDTSKVVKVESVEHPSTSIALGVQNLCENSLFSFQVPTQGGIAPLAYQWQKSSVSEGPWMDIAGAQDSMIYAYSPAGTTYYRMLIRSEGRGCNTASSNAVAVHADAKTEIFSEPRDTSLCVGLSANLSVRASNPSLHEWQVSNTAEGPFSTINDEHSANYQVSILGTGDQYYRVMVLNGFCRDTSRTVKVTGVPAIEFDQHPQDFSACEGSNIPALMAKTTGGGSTVDYQWQESSASNGTWTNINAATDSAFSPSAFTGLRYYRLRAQSSACPEVFSSTAQLTIDRAVKVTIQPSPVEACQGANAAIGVIATGNPKVQWQSASQKEAPFSNIDNSNWANYMPSTASIGTTFYRALIYSDNQLCHDTSIVVPVTIAPPVSFVSQTKDITTCADGSSTLETQVRGGFAPLNYQWQSSSADNGPWNDVPTAQDSIYKPNSAPGLTYYRLVASSKGLGCASANSEVAKVEVIAPIRIATEPQGFTACVGSQQNLSVSTSNPSITQYQWQSSADGQNGWSNLDTAQSAQFIPPSNRNYSSAWYRIVVKDGTVGCGADTSQAVLVTIRTDFKIQKTLDICNNNFYGNNAQVQFVDLIQSGDRNSRWTSLDTLRSNSPLSSLDFSNWTAAKNYRFIATTTNATGSCTNVSDTLSVLVKACCPLVCSNAPAEAFCNEGSGPIQLSSYLCANAESSGTWFITAGPGVNNPEALSTGVLNPQQRTPGIYTLSYQLAQNIRGCQTSSAQQFNIVQSVKAGTPLPDFSTCNNSSTLIDLFTLLEGATAGGKWSVLNGNTGATFNPNGTLNVKGLGAGNYRFQYKVSGAQGCRSDSAQVGLNVEESPSFNLGADLQLTCATPFATLSSPDSNNTQLRFAWTELSGQNINSPNAAKIRINSAGTYVLWVQLAGSNCAGADTVLVSTAATFITAINAEVSQPRCAGEQNAAILVKNVSGGKAPFTFTLNGQSANSGGQYRNLKAGTYTLLVKDANNCSREETYLLAEAPALNVELSGPQQYARCEEPITLKINSSASNIDVVQWQLPQDIVVEAPDSLTRVIRPKASTIAKVVLMDQNGCQAESQLAITMDKKIGVYLPNAFSPNGSKGNQIFKPLAPAEKIQRVNSFRVMDRWGNQVFEQVDMDITDASLGWDGFGKSGIYNQGVYVYAVEVTYCDGGKEKMAGEVLLLR